MQVELLDECSTQRRTPRPNPTHWTMPLEEAGADRPGGVGDGGVRSGGGGGYGGDGGDGGDTETTEETTKATEAMEVATAAVDQAAAAAAAAEGSLAAARAVAATEVTTVVGGAPPKVGVSLCGNGHALWVRSAWAPSLCDVCHRDVAQGEKIWVCGPCDHQWWACTECRAQDLVLSNADTPRATSTDVADESEEIQGIREQLVEMDLAELWTEVLPSIKKEQPDVELPSGGKEEVVAWAIEWFKAKEKKDKETWKSVFDGEDTEFKKAKLLDASMLQPGESLAKRDLQEWTLQGDFSGRNFEGANLRRAVARCANFRDASMRGVDASRADFRGASLAGVAVHGAKFRRANCERARMAGMWSGPDAETRPEVEADEDGTMPPVEPLAATDEVSNLYGETQRGDELARGWAEEEATPVDTAKDGDEDAQDETAWAAFKQELRLPEEYVATLVDMQHMNAS